MPGMFVSDWERAIQFYTETLGMQTTFRSDEMGWAQLATGDHLARLTFLVLVHPPPGRAHD